MLAMALALVAGVGVSAGEAQTGRYIVVFKSGSVPADARDRIARAGGRTHRELPEIGVAIAAGTPAFASAIARDPAVFAAGPERLHRLPSFQMLELDEQAVSADGAPTAADSLYFYQWDMRRIGAPAVWARSPLATGGRRPTVAVLDTGVAHDHPDLSGQVVVSKATSYCSTPGPGGADAYPVYSTLIDFDTYPVWYPSDGCTGADTIYEAHGTHVAGTVASKFGGGRVVGTAPDGAVAAYKVFDRYRFTDPEEGVIDDVGAFDGPIFAAIIDATLNGYPVISMSLGGYGLRFDKDDNASWHAWDRIAKWANRQGALIVASAGNGEANLNGPLAHTPSDLPTVLSTSATGWSELALSGGQYAPAPGSSDVLAFYSNYGAAVDIAAPGGDCGPTYPDGCQAQYLILNTFIRGNGTLGYAFLAGTSMATPHVSAVAAMVRALHPDWTPGQVRAYLKATAQKISSRQSFGAGMIDADAAVR